MSTRCLLQFKRANLQMSVVQVCEVAVAAIVSVPQMAPAALQLGASECANITFQYLHSHAQGPIYKSIEWLDRLGMDIIEQVCRWL